MGMGRLRCQAKGAILSAVQSRGRSGFRLPSVELSSRLSTLCAYQSCPKKVIPQNPLYQLFEAYVSQASCCGLFQHRHAPTLLGYHTISECSDRANGCHTSTRRTYTGSSDRIPLHEQPKALSVELLYTAFDLVWFKLQPPPFMTLTAAYDAARPNIAEYYTGETWSFPSRQYSAKLECIPGTLQETHIVSDGRGCSYTFSSLGYV